MAAAPVAKIPVHKFSHVDPLSMNGQHRVVDDSGNMDEDEIFAQLQDDSYAEERTHILDELTKRVRRDGGRLTIENRHALFHGLAYVLADPNWDVRLKCIQLICELVPQFGSELDSCMYIVLPHLVTNLGDSKVAVRKSVIQTLHVYMKHTTNVQQVFSALVKHGIESDNPRIRAEATINLPVLLTPEFAHVDLSNVTQSLAHKFSSDDEVRTADISLDRIRSLVGDSKFERYVKELPPKVRSAYVRKSSRPVSVDLDHVNSVDLNSNRTKPDASLARKLSELDTTKLEFGIVPVKVMNQLLNQDSWNVRAKGVGELKTILQNVDDTGPILPHMLAFIGFLCNLIDDMNFKVTLETLHIFEILVSKLSVGVKPYLKPLVSALAKRFGDNKVVIQQANIKVLMQLMQILSPKPVVAVVAESLKHRKSGVREEALNIIITSLLTFPSYDFDLAQLCDAIAPTLGDPKRRVRQASLEAFAVLAQAMGPSRIAPLIHAVDQVELNMDEEGVMKAVQARLARRQLPRIDDDGLVKYASSTPSSATSRSSPNTGADTLWILKGTGSSSSARERSNTEPGLELGQISPTKMLAGTQETPPKRFYSAGRGRSKLPWEENRDARVDDLDSSMNRPQASSAPLQNQKLRRDVERQPPLKARPMWDAEDVWEHNTSTNGRTAQRRAKSLQSIAKQESANENGGGSSYRQIHLDKLKRASIATYPGRRPSPSDEPYSGSYSAPNTQRGAVKSKHTVDEDDILGGPDPFMGNTAVIAKKHMRVRQDNQDRESYGNDKFGSHPGVNAISGKDDAGRVQRMSLSNSWPDSGFEDAPRGKKTRESRHEPVYPDWTDPSTKKPSKGGPVQSPIPMKPTLARSAGRRGQRATLEPIEKSINMGRDDYDEWEGLGVSDSIKFELSDDDDDDDDVLEMSTSLLNVRNSAAKKRAQKMAQSEPKKNQSNGMVGHTPSPPLQESGFFSMFSTLNSQGMEDTLERYPPANNMKKKGKKSTSDSPFSNRPRMARSSSGKGSRKNSAEHMEAADPNAFSYNPSSGVTFQDRQSDVSIVGQGYSKSSGQDDPEDEVWRSDSPPIPTLRNQNARERKRQQRPSGSGLVSPLGMASLQKTGPVEVDEADGDFQMVIGKGMFGGGPSEAVVQEYPSAQIQDNGYGKEHEDEYGVSMSKATKDRIARKQIEKKEEIEQRNAERKAEKERRQQEIEERNAERERRQREELEQRNAEREKRQQEELERRNAERERRNAERLRQREAKQKAMERDREEKEAQQRELEEERRRAKERERVEREARQKAMDEERKKQREEQREKLRQLEKEREQRASELAIEATRPSSLSITGGVQYPPPIAAVGDTYRGAIPADEASSSSNGTEEYDDSTPTSPLSASGRITNKPPHSGSTPKKKKSPPEWKTGGRVSLNRSISGSSQSSTSVVENGETDELKPCANPEGALRDALRYMQSSDWEVKIDGLNLVSRLATFHPNELTYQLHTVIVAVLNEVKNLRSSVARSAISRLGDMFEAVKQAMDKDLDHICKALLPKAGESSGFIREDVDKTLDSMVRNATAQRVLVALIQAGGGHKNSAVRKATAMSLERVVERMGPGRVLSGIKDVTDKVLPTAASFALDSAQETRYYGRKTLYSLMNHEEFDKLIKKHVQARDQKPLTSVLENLRVKGLGDPPVDTSSARARRSVPTSRAPSGRDNSAGSENVPSSGKRGTKKSAPRMNESTQESVKDLCKMLSASDWTSRLHGIQQFQQMCETNVNVVTANIVKIFDNFNPRISDSNSKVNLAALHCLHTVVPLLGEHLAAVTTAITPMLSGNLASKNSNICQTSQNILDLLMQHVELNVLVQPFANATQYGNARTKPIMVEKLAYLCQQVYPRKPQTVIRQVLPVLWYLLGNMSGSGVTAGGSGSIRGATGILASALYEFMGDDLMQHASTLPPRHKNMLKELIDTNS